MPSAILEDHLAALAQALADIIQERGGPSAPTTAELAGRTGTPGSYLRVIGSKHLDALNDALRPLGVRAEFFEWWFRVEPLAHGPAPTQSSKS